LVKELRSEANSAGDGHRHQTLADGRGTNARFKAMDDRKDYPVKEAHRGDVKGALLQ
jgi:hypothetical protein